MNPTALLLDPNGKVGHEYHATNTPHMFVINPEGKADLRRRDRQQAVDRPGRHQELDQLCEERAGGGDGGQAGLDRADQGLRLLGQIRALAGDGVVAGGVDPGDVATLAAFEAAAARFRYKR